MNNYTFNDGGTRYVRVSKVAARKAFDAGKPVVLCPVKLQPFGAFRPSHWADKKRWPDCDFDYVVREFVWLNCQHNETGRYAAYYVQVTQ